MADADGLSTGKLGSSLRARFTFESKPAADKWPGCAQTLSPMQEAWLEANSYPWCPDIWCVEHQMPSSTTSGSLCCAYRAHIRALPPASILETPLLDTTIRQCQLLFRYPWRLQLCNIARCRCFMLAVCRAMTNALEQQAAAAEARPSGRRSSKSKSDASSGSAAAAAASGQADWDPSAGLALDSLGAAGGLLPLNTAFQLLVTPSLAHGVGLRLKREHSPQINSSKRDFQSSALRRYTAAAQHSLFSCSSRRRSPTALACA